MSTLRSGPLHDIIEQTGRALSLPSLGIHLKYSIGKFCSYYLQEKMKDSLQSARIWKNTDFVYLLCDYMYCVTLKIERELIYLLISDH